MQIEKVDVNKIIKLEDSKFYQIKNDFGFNAPAPGYIWKLLFYKEVTEYLDSKKQKKTVTVNV